MMEIEQQAAMNGYEAAGSVAVFRRFDKNVLSLNECGIAQIVKRMEVFRTCPKHPHTAFRGRIDIGVSGRKNGII